MITAVCKSFKKDPETKTPIKANVFFMESSRFTGPSLLFYEINSKSVIGKGSVFQYSYLKSPKYVKIQKKRQ